MVVGSRVPQGDGPCARRPAARYPRRCHEVRHTVFTYRGLTFLGPFYFLGCFRMYLMIKYDLNLSQIRLAKSLQVPLL